MCLLDKLIGGRQETPVIGNEVWIGINAVGVGKITIGDDVMIAPNSYVNCEYRAFLLQLVIPALLSIGRMRQKDILIGKYKSLGI